jgi:hypothetical protein
VSAAIQYNCVCLRVLPTAAPYSYSLMLRANKASAFVVTRTAHFLKIWSNIAESGNPGAGQFEKQGNVSRPRGL